MSNGVIEGLKEVGAKRVAVATAYNDVVNERLRAFLIEHGLEPVVVTGMGIEAIADVDKVTQNDLLEFGARVRASARGADSMLLSCGGFRTLELIAPLEARTGVPVISSMPHGLWAGARLVGMSGAAPGYGKLLSRGAWAELSKVLARKGIKRLVFDLSGLDYLSSAGIRCFVRAPTCSTSISMRIQQQVRFSERS